MKLLLLLGIAVISLSATPLSHKKDGEKVYYFCRSRAWPFGKVTGKQVIFYTAIMEGPNNTAYIDKRTQEFATLVKNKCENPGGCTSDLDYSSTYEEAKKGYDYFQKQYLDSMQFTMKKLDF